MRKNRIRELERLIEETEERIAALEEEMADEAVFSDYKLMNEKCEETEKCRRDLESFYEEWAMLE